MIAPNRRILAGVVLALSNFMVVLDLTIANVSIAAIDFSPSPANRPGDLAGNVVLQDAEVRIAMNAIDYNGARVLFTCQFGATTHTMRLRIEDQPKPSRAWFSRDKTPDEESVVERAPSR